MCFHAISKGPAVEPDNPGLFFYNEPKNRYNNVLPTASRVRLGKSEVAWDDDYINADEVALRGLAQRYILTQAPLAGDNTITFWKMIWDTRCGLICALTALEERYWPLAGKSRDFANLRVRCAARRQLAPDFVRYKLELSVGDQRRRVWLLHDTRWPDFGVPASHAVALQLLDRMQRCAAPARPIVIHCSAGVGRSGTLCLLHAASQLGISGDQALEALLVELRQHRRGAVSTAEQYAYVGEVLAQLRALQRPAPADRSASPERSILRWTN
jgi:protein tyrosine phosphatase